MDTSAGTNINMHVLHVSLCECLCSYEHIYNKHACVPVCVQACVRACVCGGGTMYVKLYGQACSQWRMK